MRRYERNGRWVEVSSIRQTYFNGVPCYEVDGRGDLDLYLSAPPLYVEQTPGGWTVKYRPADDDFDTYASNLIRLGAWN